MDSQKEILIIRRPLLIRDTPGSGPLHTMSRVAHSPTASPRNLAVCDDVDVQLPGLHQSYGPFQNNVDSIQIPSQPMVSESELQAISEYYLLYAPLRFAPMKDPQLFDPVLSNTTPGLSHASARGRNHHPDTLGPSGTAYLGRASHRSLQVFDVEGQILCKKPALRTRGCHPLQRFPTHVDGTF